MISTSEIGMDFFLGYSVNQDIFEAISLRMKMK